MPTWIVHGFKWPRQLIRVHVILQNLDDAAPDWLMAPATHSVLLENFRTLYPDTMAYLPSLRFIEQHDPEDLTTKCQPYAYVCDEVHEVKLGVDIDDIRGAIGNDRWGALIDLRDNVAPGEKPGWFVVVNGDVERDAPQSISSESQTITLPEAEADRIKNATNGATSPEDSKRNSKGFKWLNIGNKVRRSKSSKELREKETIIRTVSAQPPPPQLPKNSSVPVPKHIAQTMPRPATQGATRPFQGGASGKMPVR